MNLLKQAVTFVRETLLNALNGWDEFFFAPHTFLPVGVFRFVFGLNALVMYSVRFTHWRDYFSTASFLPPEGAMEILMEYYRPTLHWFPQTDFMVVAVNATLCIALLFLMLGVFPRLAALIAFPLHIALIQRNYAVAYGADFIATFFLFSLIFIRSDVRFSLTSYFRSKRGKPRALKDGSLSQLASSASVRLLQIQLCLIYAYTGLEKMKGPTWWDGTAVWTVLGNRQLFSFDISWVRNAPLLIALMTFGTVFFEIYFAALVWIPKVRKWILSLGVMMHTGIALSMGLFYFSLGMISTYFVFLKPAFLEMVFGKMKISKAWLGDAD